MFKTYKKSIKDLGEKYGAFEFCDEMNNTITKPQLLKLENFIKSHTLKMLRVDIERLGVEIMKEAPISKIKEMIENDTLKIQNAYNKALQEEIDLKKKHYSLIKND